jgi:hypothetical protein
MKKAREWEVGVAPIAGVLLGVGLAAWRTGVYAAAAGGLDQDKSSQAGGSGDTGTVTPVPVKPGFQGEIGRTIGESRAAWPQPVRAPKGAPNVSKSHGPFRSRFRWQATAFASDLTAALRLARIIPDAARIGTCQFSPPRRVLMTLNREQ